ncbi:hypothetical protein EG328_006928 [Venturia inaequalis]|uniref:Uncharacterized protein n=1 Tax=Venturia inaequalis TaxID=5025 RepID=A0A8H3VDY6_VENIN|nr:hypothetical protein EG328_006928 [Venturia inaequalis]
MASFRILKDSKRPKMKIPIWTKWVIWRRRAAGSGFSAARPAFGQARPEDAAGHELLEDLMPAMRSLGTSSSVHRGFVELLLEKLWTRLGMEERLPARSLREDPPNLQPTRSSLSAFPRPPQCAPISLASSTSHPY